MFNLKRIAPYGLLGLIAASAAEAAATRNAFIDAFATARGNAFTATADNASAVFYNGAGLTQLEGSELRGGAFSISLGYEFESDIAAGTDEMDDGFQVVPAFFAAHKFKDYPLALGFGIYAPFALGSDWTEDASFAADPRVPYDARLAYVKYHAVLAWQLTDTLSVAAGLSYDDAEVDVKATALEFDGTDQAVGYSLSVLWQPTEQHGFGLNYQAKTETTLDGTVSGPAILAATQGATGSLDSKAELSFPESIVFGYAYRPNEKWDFEFNLDWTNWDRVDRLSLDAIPGLGYELNWESAFIWEAGVTRFFDGGWYLSGGYTFVENAVPDDDFLPIVPDSDRHFFALGLGRSHDRFRWQITYQQAFAGERSVSGNNLEVAPGASTLNGDWDLDSQAVAFSLGYRF